MRSPSGAAGVVPGTPRTGNQRPRIFTCPDWVDTAGPEVEEAGRAAGIVLDDWESWYLANALGERGDGKWAAFACGLNCPRQNGKDEILVVRQLGGLFVLGEELIIHSAHQFKTAGESYRRLLAAIESVPEFDHRVSRTPASHGEEGIELLPTATVITGYRGRQITRSRAARLRFIARSYQQARGFTGDLVIYNEAMILDAEAVAASLPTLGARFGLTDGGPQVWYTGSAGIGRVSTQWAKVRRRGIQGGSSLCYAEWSIDPHTEYCARPCAEPGHLDPFTEEAYATANPGYNIRLMAEMIPKFRDEMDDPTFLRELLGVGVYPAPEDGWAIIPRRWWEDRLAKDDLRPNAPAGGIDVTPSRSFSAIGVAGTRDDGFFGLELADHRPGTGWVVGRAAEIDRRAGGMVWAVDRTSEAGALIADLEKAGLRVEIPTGTDVAYACGRLYDAYRDDRLRTADDREVRNAIAGVAERKIGGKMAWDRVNSRVDICGLYAWTLALWAHERFGDTGYDLAESVGFDLAEIKRLCGLGVYGPADLARLHQSGLITDAGLSELAADGIRVPAGLI